MSGDYLWILVTCATGMAIVVGGILWLRLHAFLALLFAAIAVAAMTPASTVTRYLALQHAVRITAAEVAGSRNEPVVDSSEIVWQLATEGSRIPSSARVYRVVREIDHRLHALDGVLVPIGAEPRQPKPSTSRFRLTGVGSGNVELREQDWLIAADDWDRAAETAATPIAEQVAAAFGATAGKIGILIAMASIIGLCLLESGAADRIIRSTLQWFGERAAPAAFLLSGFVLGIPVFFDTVFYLMIPLGKAMALRLGRNYLLLVMAMIAGATMAHSLVPPTPGPLVVAELLGVDLGLMMIGGSLVGLCAATAGFLYASLFANRRWTLPLRESSDLPLDTLKQQMARPASDLPSLGWSLAPIALPVLLITGHSASELLDLRLPVGLHEVIRTLGDKNIAISLAAVVAMVVLIRTSRLSRRDLATRIATALNSGGTIILITAAGGAFGKMLQQSGITTLVAQAPVTSTPTVLLFAFAITTLIRTAQGSATVAMMTAVPIVAGLATARELPFHPLYLALAVGCGSKPIPWMNDSGFWVITKMSGMSESEGLRYVAPLVSLMGLVGIAVVIGAALFLPLTG